MVVQRFPLVLLCLAALVLSSCGGGSTETTTTGDGGGGADIGATTTTVATPQEPLRRDPLSNVKLGQYMSDLDGGRVDVAAPKAWKWGPRKNEFIVWYYIDEQLPRITVKGEAIPDGSIDTVTEDNVSQFLAAMNIELADRKKEEELLAMVVGDRPCVRYVEKAGLSGSVVDRQILITHMKGRRYTIDLQLREGEILEYRDAGYAVLAAMKFHDQTTTTGNDPGGEGETTETKN